MGASINSRRKGRSAEQEIARMLFDELGVTVRRNLVQSRDGGVDLVVGGHDPAAVALDQFAMEVKRARQATPALLANWWAQAWKQTTGARSPALFYREDRRPWRVVVPMFMLMEGLPPRKDLEWAVELSLQGFCLVVRERC